MKATIALTSLFSTALFAACSTTSNTNANLRGANTNTGYMANSTTNAKPTIAPNAMNIEPPSMGNSNTMNTNRGGAINSNMKF